MIMLYAGLSVVFEGRLGGMEGSDLPVIMKDIAKRSCITPRTLCRSQAFENFTL